MRSVTTKKREAVEESQRFRCTNPSCQKVFDEPIKAKNLGPESEEVYDACPYCLTAIASESSSLDEKSEKLEAVTSSRSEPVGVRSEKETSGPSPPKGQGCTRHLGYLSERPTREKIPEECIVCENVLQCMLKAVTVKSGSK
jgi:hypothetical protein